MDIKVLFYDYYGQLNSEQTITISDELASLDMTLRELESYGIISPVLNDITIRNNTYIFTKFEYHLSKIESTYYKYIFWAKYVEEDLLLSHYNDKVDKLQEVVERLDVDINSFIAEHNNTISELEDKVQNWNKYQELADELGLVEDANAVNETKMAIIESGDYESHVRQLEVEYSNFMSEVDEIQDNVDGAVNDFYSTLYNHQTTIDYIKQKVNNKLKYVFTTQDDYNYLHKKDTNTLYIIT